MKPVYNTGGLPVAVAQAFTNILSTEIEKAQLSEDVSDVILNFRYPTYSAEKGGFTPVEVRSIRQGNEWHLDYVTEFTYVGMGPYAELVTDLNFDFGCQAFTCMYGNIPKQELNDAFKFWARNFTAYYLDDIYEVSVTAH